jgi:uncharacterized membrane protein YkoI
VVGAIGLAVGSIGVAGAATGGSAAADGAADTEVQEPSHVGSIQVAEDEGISEADEANLEGFATITADEAAQAAVDAVPGDVAEVELDNENGNVVYSVGVTDASGSEVDVKVDAGDGTILDQQADDQDDEVGEADEAEGEDEADDDAVEHENEHEGDNDADAGHED